MNKTTGSSIEKIDHDDIECNESSNAYFSSIMEARLSRRSLLRGGAASAASVLLGSLGLSASGEGNAAGGPAVKRLGFNAVPKSLADVVTVPDGYTATVLYALGDPLTTATPAYRNDGTDTDFEHRAGDHHDGMEFFGLSPSGKPSENGFERGLLAINHEATTNESLSSFFLHADGGTNTLPRPAAEIDKETAIHGIAVVEVRKRGAMWEYVQDSPFNNRVTAMSDIEISGPARGNALLVTKYSSNGTKTRGTLNNCGTGKTPWGTFLTGEENWFGYFTRSADDDAARGNDKSTTSLKRYGRKPGSASRHGWESGGADDRYARWNISKSGASVDGSDDYRNEMNGMGYIVEFDPYDKRASGRKRTALGRFAHESAAFGTVKAGQPLTVYMGDDSRGEYIYKFVSAALWDPADAHAADRLAVGGKYLDQGRLYVARFNADGSGRWLELSTANPAIAAYGAYPFTDHADVVVNARLAADAAGATKMDRPEWCSVNPANGEIYFALTNNSKRRVDPAGSEIEPDGPNPRAYTDVKGDANGDGKQQHGNVNGHILRMKEGMAGGAGADFIWDVYLFGAEAGADRSRINLSGLSQDQDFSSPDGLAFGATTGICWFQTDDGAYADVSNCMMMAALPGQVGDGGKLSLHYPQKDGGTLTVDTFVGKQPTSETLKRFLVGPVDCEITGLCETPDGRAMFVNIQHPGENTAHADVGDPAKYNSQWPANAGYGAGKRPRSATIVITKNDGGRIGS